MTTTTAPARTLTDALGFIATAATNDDLDRIYEAANARAKVLRDQRDAERAAVLTVGASVEVDGVRPKYLNGLRGTVASITGQRVTVTLDADSTRRLSYTRQTKFYVPVGADSYDLSGLPVGACKTTT